MGPSPQSRLRNQSFASWRCREPCRRLVVDSGTSPEDRPTRKALRVSDPNMHLRGLLWDTLIVPWVGVRVVPPQGQHPHETETEHRRTDGFCPGLTPGMASFTSKSTLLPGRQTAPAHPPAQLGFRKSRRGAALGVWARQTKPGGAGGGWERPVYGFPVIVPLSALPLWL